MSARVFRRVNHRLTRTPLSPEATLKHERQSCAAGESWHFSEDEIGRCERSRITARLLTVVGASANRAAAAATRDYYFYPFKNRLSATILRIQISLPSVQMSRTCIPHPINAQSAQTRRSKFDVRSAFWRHSLTAAITCSWWRHWRQWRHDLP